MKRIGLSLLLFASVVFAAVHPVFGQLFTADRSTKSPPDTVVRTYNFQPAGQTLRQPATLQIPTSLTKNNPTRNIEVPKLVLASATAPESESAQISSRITFSSPTSAGVGEGASVSFSSSDVVPILPVRHATPVEGGVQAQPVPTPFPAQVARQVASNAITKSHRLRLAPQVFEKNLLERLGTRFVPVRSIEDATGVSQYRLPARDGTDIELAIDFRRCAISVTGAPQTVESCLQIVRFLDTEEVVGGPVARFVPVQQSNINSARRVAGIVNQATVRVAQALPGMSADMPFEPPTPVEEQMATVTPGGDVISSVVGPVNIDIIDALGTMVIKGSPKDVAAVRAMLQQLETLSLENEPVVELIPIHHADSVRVNQLVVNLYNMVYVQRRGNITTMALVKPNTILIIGKQESIDTAKELIAKLDTPVNPNTGFRIFLLKHAVADTLMGQINNTFTQRPGANVGFNLAPQVVATADVRTNALIVQANPRDMLEVEAMIRQLDVSGSEITTTMKAFPLKYAMAAELAQILQAALSGTYQGVMGQRTAQLEIGKLDANGNPMRASLLNNVLITSDTRNNQIIVTAPTETMPLIGALIEQLDQLPTAKTRIKVFTLTHGNAYDLMQMLTSLFAAGSANQVTAVGPGFEPGDSSLVGVRFQSDTRSNSIIAIGGEADLVSVEALLRRLDSENLNNRRIFTMKVINVPVEILVPILNDFLTTERSIDQQNPATFLPQSPLEQYQKEVNIVPEPITNSLIISTTPRYYEQIKKVVMELDERPMMVAIEVLIAEVTLNHGKDRGVEFGLQDSILFDRATSINPASSVFPSLSASNPSDSVYAGSVGAQGITSLGVGQGNGFSFSASNESVSIFIRALETRNKTQVLARPRLVTLHNMRAQLDVGQQVPFASGATVGMGGTIVPNRPEMLPVGTALDITPRIMLDGMVSMAVFVERSSVAGWRDIGGTDMPELTTATTSTTINAMDGETVIFSGLITEEKTSKNTSVPVLNKIPVVKYFFENDSKNLKRTELLIVLTPRIIRTQEDMNRLNRAEQERMQWCISDVVRMTGNHGMRRRSDEWSASDVRYTPGSSVRLNDSQLPAENKIPMPMLMAPSVEMK